MDATATAVFGDGTGAAPRKRRRHERSGRRQHSHNAFAEVKHGLDSVRSVFYTRGRSTRLPNTDKSDLTRRSRTLEGGPGDRHLTALDLWTEREISRFLRDRSPQFDGMIETWAAEVIQTGWRLTPATGDKDLDILLRELLTGWDGDGGWLSECDQRGMMHFWDLLTLDEETELTDGDSALYLDPDGNNGLGTVSIVEADRILTPYGLQDSEIPEGHFISNGVLMNAMGRPVALWVADVAPRNCCASVEMGGFVPVFDPARPELGGLVFSCKVKRYTATRRQPWLSTVVRPHDEIDDVFTAVRVALRNAACRATYTTIKDWDAYRDWMERVDDLGDAPAPADPLEHSPDPGDHVLFNPGEEGGVFETNAPGNNFDPFMHLQLNSLGLPLGMCLEEAFRIFQKNFSASRLAIGSTRRRYRRRQRTLKRRKLAHVLKFAVSRLQKNELLPMDPRCCQLWVGFGGWPYMEPAKDAVAIEKLVNLKALSRTTAQNESDRDPDQERANIESEQRWLASLPAAGGDGDSDPDGDWLFQDGDA